MLALASEARTRGGKMGWTHGFAWAECFHDTIRIAIAVPELM